MITGTLEFDYIMSMENLVTKQCFRPLSINPPIIVPDRLGTSIGKSH